MAKREKKRKNRIASLRFKAVIVILISAIILAVIPLTISYNTYSATMEHHYKDLASNLAKTAATQLDADALTRYYEEVKTIGEYNDDKYWNDEAYRAEYDKKADAIKDEEYYEMLDMLFDIKDSNEVEFLYVQKLEGDMCTYIFDADRADDKCQLGTTHEVSGPTKETENPEYGIPAFITNDSYGWLCTCMEPVLDDNGKPVALVGVDVSMNEIVKKRETFLRSVITLMAIGVIIVIVIILSSIDLTIIKPIDKLSAAARSFVENRSGDDSNEFSLSQLNIRTGDEIETLCDSIKQMERDINAYIANLTAVTAEKERIGAELGLATKIQANMLPNIFPAFPDRDDFDIYATMIPAKEVGGDFYDFFLVDDTHLGMVIADVSGKGVPAALFMMMSKILIKNAAITGKSPAEALETVNNQICANNHEEMFVTVWLGILDLKTGVLAAANAGHEKPIVKHNDGQFEQLIDKHGFVIGGMPGLKYKGYEIQLEKGAKIFLYTDGVAEATNNSDELFGTDRTVAVLNEVKDENPKAILERVKLRVDEFVGNAPQFDDLTMLCLEYVGLEDSGEEITIDAKLESVASAIDFVSERTEELPLSMKDKHQIGIAIDEIVSNVARYAYTDSTGKAAVRIDTDAKGITITVTDSGVPYNPLEKEDPDVTLSADERGIGGYGIFIVKQVMDELTYEYKDGKNIFTMRKNYEE